MAGCAGRQPAGGTQTRRRSTRIVPRHTAKQTHRLIEKRGFHFHQLATLWKAAFVDVGDVFAEGGEAFLLQATVFGGEIAVGPGVAGPVCES